MLTLSVTSTGPADEESGIDLDQIVSGVEEILTIADTSGLPAADITLDTNLRLPSQSYDPRARLHLPRAQREPRLREPRLRDSGNGPLFDTRQNVPLYDEVCNDVDQGVVGEECVMTPTSIEG